MNKEMMKTKFKKFGGQFIPDIIEYLKEYVKQDPNVTISVGCDSVQRRRKTVYAITIMLYNDDIKNGAHVIFFRENVNKVRDHFDRLQREAEYALNVGQLIDEELSPFFQRKDLVDKERKRYKYHIMKSSGQYSHIQNEDSFINNLTLSDSEKQIPFKLVDIHVDYNPHEGVVDKKGVAKNKSNMSYKSMVPYLRSMGFRVFCKPMGFASTSAADLLLQE
jgi:predicted RNase H-related nuclease YkuK (DUF458 family)